MTSGGSRSSAAARSPVQASGLSAAELERLRESRHHVPGTGRRLRRRSWSASTRRTPGPPGLAWRNSRRCGRRTRRQAHALESAAARMADRRSSLYRSGVHRSDTFEYLTDASCGGRGRAAATTPRARTTAVLARAVASDELALGFLAYRVVDQNKRTLKALSVDDGRDDDGKGPIPPSPETVRNGTYAVVPAVLHLASRRTQSAGRKCAVSSSSLPE